MNIRKEAYAVGVGIAFIAGLALVSWLAVEVSFWIGGRYLVPILGEWAVIAPMGGALALLMAWAFGHAFLMEKSREGSD